MVGVAHGLRQAVAGDAGEREFYGGLETHAVTDGDVDRLHAGAGAHYRPMVSAPSISGVHAPFTSGGSS